MDRHSIQKIIIVLVVFMLSGLTSAVSSGIIQTKPQSLDRSITWKTTLTASETGGEDDTCFIGEAPDAHDGPPADTYDIAKPPGPMPPYVRFWSNDNLSMPYTSLWFDIRHYPGLTKTWNISVQWVPSDYSSPTIVTIHWNSANFTASEYTTSVSLCTWTGTILKDMLTTSSYTFNCPALTPQKFKIICHAPQIEYTLTTTVQGSGAIQRSPDQPTYHLGDQVQLTALPSQGWYFDHWSGDLTGSTNPATITITGNMAVTATFLQYEYTLSTSVQGSGTVQLSPSQATYHYGDQVQLTAQPSPGWYFDHWSGGLTGTTNPATITIIGNTAVNATFTQYEYTLSITIQGSGTVQKSPNQQTYHYGDQVQLTAQPSQGWYFDHWSGGLTGTTNPATITITGITAVTATFTQYEYTLAISVQGSGTVEKSPNQQTYHYGDQVQLTAQPSQGWYFDHWSGALTGNQNPATITITGNMAVTAVFSQYEYTLTTNVVGSGNVQKSPNQQTYHYGDQVQLTAQGDLGWHFDHWSGNLTGTTNPATITISGNMSVTATFLQDEYTLDLTIIGSGNVTKDPDQATYHYGDVVTLTAIPSQGWVFDHWSGGLTGNQNPATITIYSDTNITATFLQAPNNPPYEPKDPSPENGSGDVSLNPVLRWTGGDPDAGDAVTYDVYFGTVTPPPNVASNITNTSYTPGTLNWSTLYYWQIVAWDNHHAKTVGDIWHFTTQNDTVPPYVNIAVPKEGYLYILPESTHIKIHIFFSTIVIGPIIVEVDAKDNQSGIDRVDFYVDNDLRGSSKTWPYQWEWGHEQSMGYDLKVIAYDKAGNQATDHLKVLKIW